MNIDLSITGKTRVLGLVGNLVEHSLSPILHNTLSKILNTDTIYVPFKVEKSDLSSAIKGLRSLNVLGFNVTVPYKREVMKYIDNNARETFLMGAVNTVKNIDGRLYGYNTDGEGFVKAFKEESKVDFANKKVVLIGAGGVARAIAVKLALEGASKISLVNRTMDKATEISEIVNDNIKEIVQIYKLEDKTFQHAFKESEIIINATSLGMYPETDAPSIYYNYFESNQIVYDVIYNPFKTKFLNAAEKKGCKILNGMKMLFYQGIYAYEIWTGVKISNDLLKELYVIFNKAAINQNKQE